MGYLPQAMVNYLALLGWGDGTENEFFTLDHLGLWNHFITLVLPFILRDRLLSLHALFKYLSVLFTNNFSWEIFNWSCQQKWCHFWLYQAKVIIALNLLYEEDDCLRFLLPSISFCWRNWLSEHFAVAWLFCWYRFSWFTVDHVYENLGCFLNSWINCFTEVFFLIIFSYVYKL